MTVETRIIDGPIPTAAPAKGAGATLTFEGLVRPLEDARPIAALDYEAYEPMASRQLQSLAESIVRHHNLISLTCHHSRGRIPVGQCSLRIIIHSPHRAEALAAMAEFIDKLKQDVPIWKKPVWQ